MGINAISRINGIMFMMNIMENEQRINIMFTWWGFDI